MNADTDTKSMLQISANKTVTFNGTDFFNKYSQSVFLSTSKGQKFVKQILASGVQLKGELKCKSHISLKGIKLGGEDLIIKKGSVDSVINPYDFTLKRLQGFCAAYACCHKERFAHDTIVAIAASLGYELTPQSSDDFRKFYFSFAPGAERFSNVFEFWPLVSTLVHMTLKKNVISIESTISKFNVKNDQKIKLLHYLGDNNIINRILPVVKQTVDGTEVDFSDCLASFKFLRSS